MDACNADTDGDGMTDDWEFAFSAANIPGTSAQT